jgi:hypothetical protein
MEQSALHKAIKNSHSGWREFIGVMRQQPRPIVQRSAQSVQQQNLRFKSRQT